MALACHGREQCRADDDGRNGDLHFARHLHLLHSDDRFRETYQTKTLDLILRRRAAPSRRMETCAISLAAVLRDARNADCVNLSALRAPQDEDLDVTRIKERGTSTGSPT